MVSPAPPVLHAINKAGGRRLAEGSDVSSRSASNSSMESGSDRSLPRSVLMVGVGVVCGELRIVVSDATAVWWFVQIAIVTD